MNFRSISDLSRTIMHGAHRVAGRFDLVVGVPRSGLLAANLLAVHLDLPLADIDGLIAGRVMAGGRRRDDRAALDPREGCRVLVLDDSVLSGTEISRVRGRIEAARLPHEITYAAVYAAPRGTGHVDLFFERCSMPRLFEWNLAHNVQLKNACVDIDGVLCADPTDAENDDGPGYERFLESARPLLRPTWPIGRLVTCRLEKHRAATERWLAAMNISYGELIMWDLPSGAARRRAGGHARFKAGVYRRCGATLFIESSASQANEISERSGKPVICVEDMRAYLPGRKALVMALARRAPRTLIHRLRRADAA